MSLMYLKPKGDVMRESVPTEQRFVKKVDYLKEGGILTWFFAEKYPEKQLVYPEMFAVLNPLKKTIPALLRVIKENTLAKILLVLMLIVPGARRLRLLCIKAFTDIFWSGLRFVALQPSHLCPSAKEVRRTLLEIFKDHPDQILVEQLTDCVALFWEYDNAYRYRGQDVAGIVQKEAFLTNPAKELGRVFDEYIKRELEIKGKAKMFKNVAVIFMYIPKYRTLAKQFMSVVNLEKLKLDEGDRYWCYHRTDYNADGLTIYQRLRKRSLMKLT